MLVKSVNYRQHLFRATQVRTLAGSARGESHILLGHGGLEQIFEDIKVVSEPNIHCLSQVWTWLQHLGALSKLLSRRTQAYCILLM